MAEVTVEDPAPGFQLMRDSVDFEWASEMDCNVNKIGAATTMESLPSIARELKLTLAQVTFVYEAWQYNKCRRSAKRRVKGDGDDDEEDDDDDDEATRAFRLVVKRRLLQANGDIRALAKPDMQRELERLWEEQRVRYNRMATRVNRVMDRPGEK